MVRALFKSEARALRNLILDRWNVCIDDSVPVQSEVVVEGRAPPGGPRFNQDFVLEFGRRPVDPDETDCAAGPILPNSIGASVSVLVEKRTCRPLLLELMFGDAFPIERYSQFIAAVECCLHDVLSREDIRERLQSLGVTSQLPELKRRACIATSASCRVLVVGEDTCFLVFPEEPSPIMRGRRQCLVESPQFEIDCYIADCQIVCFDGWVATGVPRSDLRLVAALRA